MTAAVIRGDARRLPLPDASVDLVITSPPYFGLRDYGYAGQIGSEATPGEWLASLLECTAEWVRVLKPEGSIFVNLGDKYNSAASNQQGDVTAPSTLNRGKENRHTGRGRALRNAPPKCLLGLPWRYALGCADQLGLILRAEIIWAKPNCLSGGTMVYAKVKGRPLTIKVHDLCRAYAPHQVQLWNGQRWTQVLWWQPTGRHPGAAESYKAIRAARRRGGEPIAAADIEIQLRSGERIGCTREHRWPTQRGLVKAADLVAGDVLDTCPMPEGETVPAALDDEMVGWFTGLYIAEGSHSEGTIQIAGHVKEAERYKRLRELAEAFHGTCAVHATGGNGATINLTGRFLDAIIDTYVGGRTAKDKHLRPACWQRSNRFLRAVLDGYLAGDGHWREDAHRWVVGFTDNDALAADLRALGARLGLSVRLTRCTHTGFGKEWPGWRGNITEPHRRRQPDSQIIAIRQSRARQFWDIGVADEPHLFALASGVLTHNSLPESVTDRVRRAHEQVFHLVRQPRYYAAVDEIREAHHEGPGTHSRGPNGNRTAYTSSRGDGRGFDHPNGRDYNPLGKLPGSVWEIPSSPLVVPPRLGIDHFAAFPMELPRRVILGWSPAGVCTACAQGRRPVVDKGERFPVENFAHRKRPTGKPIGPIDRGEHSQWLTGSVACASGQEWNAWRASHPDLVTGYACACPQPDAPTRPAVILDPFGGTGTTALVASVLGRHGISVDLSADYTRLARWRTTDPGERARAMQVPKPPPVPDGQDALFALESP